jgi:hypothetical protein
MGDLIEQHAHQRHQESQDEHEGQQHKLRVAVDEANGEAETGEHEAEGDEDRRQPLEDDEVGERGRSHHAPPEQPAVDGHALGDVAAPPLPLPVERADRVGDVSPAQGVGDEGDTVRDSPRAHLPGPHPDRANYMSFAEFSDPDGNTWLLQERRGRPSTPDR